MLAIHCKVCGLLLINFGVHDFDDSWYCGMKCFEDQKKLDEVVQPVDYVIGGDKISE